MKKTKSSKPKTNSKVGTVKRLWAAVHHSPYKVEEFIQDLSTNNFDGRLRCQIVTHKDILDKTELDAHILIIVTGNLLELLLAKGYDLSNSTVILIETAVIATEFKGIKLLDAEQPKSYVFKFKPLDSKMVLDLRGSSSDPVNVASVKVDIIPALLHAQPPSILNPVMTFAYTVADQDKRTRYLVDIFDMILRGGSFGDLSWFSPTNKKMVELNEWLNSTTGVAATKSLSKALNKVKLTDKDEDFKRLAEEHNVAKFDINYAVEFIKRIKVNHPNIDTKEMFTVSDLREDD